MHQKHDTQSAVYKKDPKGKETKSFSTVVGWNPILHRWEHCDKGLVMSLDERRKTRKRPHSQPRKKKTNTNTNRKYEDE